jgi:hypothetical protein
MELNRFKQLLESTMGDVKPLVNETDKEKVIRGILQGRQPKPQYSKYDSFGPQDRYDGEKQPSPFDSDENISYDIKSVECDGNEMGGNVYIDEDDTIVIRYCKGDSKKLDYLKRKGKMELYSKHGLS